MTSLPASAGKAICKGSTCVTDGWQVDVTPSYLPDQSDPEARRWVFRYRIRISNQSASKARLLARHWVIVNAKGDLDEVRGDGVVGEQPEVPPGESYVYASMCPLDTPWGTMEGAYRMRGEDGTAFEIKVARFYLVGPSRKE
ncbi:MAG: Co2+/Mg2+ efflux protein ApaG [Phycisphaerales bacterium]